MHRSPLLSMLLFVTLLVLLGHCGAYPELNAFLNIALQASAGAAVNNGLDPLLLEQGSIVSGISGLRIEELQQTGKHRRFEFTARIPELHIRAKSSKGTVLLLFRDLRYSFAFHLTSGGKSYTLSSLSAFPPRVSSWQALVSGFSTDSNTRRVADYCYLVQQLLLDLFKSQLQSALNRHKMDDIRMGHFRFNVATCNYDTLRIRKAKDAIAAAMVLLREQTPFLWRGAHRRYRLNTNAIFADPEASQRSDALLIQLDLQGLRLNEKHTGRVHRRTLTLKVLVVLGDWGVDVFLTGIQGRVDGPALDGLSVWVTTELTSALQRAIDEM